MTERLWNRLVAAFGDESWPDAAFVIEKGAKKDSNGKTPQKYRHLPHHNKSATSGTDNGSVDLPHLRNALARCGQVKPMMESAGTFQSRARAHLQAHAKALLKTKSAEARALCAEFGIE